MSRIRGIFLIFALVYLNLAGGGSEARAQSVTFGSPRPIADIGFSGLAQFAAGFTLNRFAVSADGTLVAAIFGGDNSQDPQALAPNLSLTVAHDLDAFLPPVILAGDEEVFDLIASVEMDSSNNLHAFSSRVSSSGMDPPRYNVVNSNSDGSVVGESIPVAPDTDPGFAQLFSNSTIDANDNLHVVFSTLPPNNSDNTGPIYYARSEDGGLTWTTPVPAVGKPNSAFNNFLYPSVAVSPDGSTVAVSYFDADKLQIRATKSSDGGASFAPGRKIFQYNSQPFSIFSKVQLDDSGKIYVSYSGDLEDDQIGEVLLSSSVDGSVFGEPVKVNQTSTNFSGPIVNMAMDSRGRIDVIWQSNAAPPDPNNPNPNDFAPRLLNFARSTDGGATFSAPQVIATVEEGQLVMNGGIRHDVWGHVFIDYLYSDAELGIGGTVYMLIGTPDDLGAPENCGDSSDNDYDGVVDCDDTECDGDAACVDDSGIGGEAEGGGCSIAADSAKLGWAGLFPTTGLLLLLLQRRKARAASRA